MKKFLVIIGSLFLISGCSKTDNIINKGKDKEPVKKLQIVDESSKSRSYAVMINNNHRAWPHAGLQESIVNYEIITEGGITRFLAVYKDNIPEQIGSVRSSRPYFLDYALENDAIYIHWGGSDLAYSDMSKLGIDHIDGIRYEGSYFLEIEVYIGLMNILVLQEEV